MPPITAILHTHNDERRLGRALQTLYACDEILIVDHGSSDQTRRVARDYSARFLTTPIAGSPAGYLLHARCDWVLCLLPSEAVSEALEASLLEWRHRRSSELLGVTSGSVAVREETAEGWTEAESVTRLVPKSWKEWDGVLPRPSPEALQLTGALLRFLLP